MKIYTSNYSNKKLNNRDYTILAISIGLPKYKLSYKINAQVYSLAPTRDMLNMDYKTYKELYIKRLEKIGLQRIKEILHKFDVEKPIVLCCFEDLEKNWCHRGMFAEWYKMNTGQEIEELGAIKNNKVEQIKWNL